MLEASEALVVYSEGFSQGHRRGEAMTLPFTKIRHCRLVKGPDIFIPMANEWLHNFSWLGQSYKAVLREVLQFSFVPWEVCAHLIFFELVDIEKIFDSTNDPISDMNNAANADVMKGSWRTLMVWVLSLCSFLVWAALSGTPLLWLPSIHQAAIYARICHLLPHKAPFGGGYFSARTVMLDAQEQ